MLQTSHGKVTPRHVIRSEKQNDVAIVYLFIYYLFTLFKIYSMLMYSISMTAVSL